MRYGCTRLNSQNCGGSDNRFARPNPVSAAQGTRWSWGMMRSPVWKPLILLVKFLAQWAQDWMVSPSAYMRPCTGCSQQDREDKEICHLANSSISVAWLSALGETILFLNKCLFFSSSINTRSHVSDPANKFVFIFWKVKAKIINSPIRNTVIFPCLDKYHPGLCFS